MFGSQDFRQDRSQAGFERAKLLNMQEFRPGRSAMQWHCVLHLFYKRLTYSTVHSL